MTKIQWTDRTWNPTTGCNKVSQGCKNCYAEKQHFRLQHMHPAKYTKAFTAGVEMHHDTLKLPFAWKKPSRVFVNSMSDLFHADVPFEFIDKVFAVMALTPQHTYQILTKRPERMLEYFSTENKWDRPDKWNDAAIDILTQFNADWHGEFESNILPNVWFGTSCENQETADQRIPYLLQVPAAVRFLSCEPLLGPVDLKIPTTSHLRGPAAVTAIENIDWVIAGGESGTGARPLHPDWVRSLRNQCKNAGVPFFFKQWGEWSAEQLFPAKRKNIAGTYLNKNGHRCGFKGLMDNNSNYQTMYKTGKALSGNLLDGKQHLEFPETENATK